MVELHNSLLDRHVVYFFFEDEVQLEVEVLHESCTFMVALKIEFLGL